MTISHGNLTRLACKAVSVLSTAAVILTVAAPTTLHARGYKHHNYPARHGGGSPGGLFAAVIAGEANPTAWSSARMCRSAENRVGTRWGHTLQAVLSMPGQYVPNWAKAARYPIYREFAAIALSRGCAAIDARGAASIGNADSFYTGCGDNCYYRSGAGRTRLAGRRGARVRYAVRTHGGKRVVAVAVNAAPPAVVPPTFSNLFGINLNN